MSLSFLLACIIFDEKNYNSELLPDFQCKTCPHLPVFSIYRKILWKKHAFLANNIIYPKCVLIVYVIFDIQLLGIYSCLLLILKVSGIYFFKYFFCPFLSFPRFKLLRPFDIAQQLSHDCCCLFFFLFFFLSHFTFSVWIVISTVLSTRVFSLPCQVCQNPPKENSSSLTMSTYSCHLHFTYESIFLIYDRIHIYWHTVHLFH